MTDLLFYKIVQKRSMKAMIFWYSILSPIFGDLGLMMIDIRSVRLCHRNDD